MLKNRNVTFANLVNHPKRWVDYYQKIKTINDHGEQELAGKLFEEFCFYYLKIDPARKGLYKEVYRQSEIPPTIKKKLSLAHTDYGVDLLLVDQNGCFIAVQCKFKSDETSVITWSKDKLANALAEAKYADGLIIMTNASGVDEHSERRGLRDFDTFNLISYSHLSGLDTATIQNIWQLSRKKVLEKLKPAKSRDYQFAAIRDIKMGFRKHNRGQLILPCGAGKTLTALWTKEALQPKLTLVMVPSLALLRQTMEEWTKHQKRWVNYVCVCSEKGIDSAVEKDSTEAHSYEIPAVTTESKELRKFLHQTGPKIVYATYQSAHVIRDALKGTSIQFDLAFCDEAHKTAGDRKSAFGLIHDDINIPIKKRLYMTATPRIVAEQVKTKLGEDVKLLADMADPKIFGPELYRMEFGDAIKKKILCDYKIVAIGVNDSEMKKNISRYVTSHQTLSDLANNYALGKVMKKNKASHAITFHSSIKRAKEFSETNKKVYQNISAALVTGEQPTSVRKQLLDEFKREHKAILSNARCLTEGIDVPAIDCVYFCDPRNSKVDIVQASGRALRQAKHKNKKFGYIVVPIYHKERAKLEEAIDESIFKNLVSVVRALADQDQRLVDEICRIKLGDTRTKRNSRIQIDMGESATLSTAFNSEALKKRLFDQLIDKSVSSWDTMILRLKDFKKTYRHTNPTFDISKKWQNLASWAHKVRLEKYRKDLSTSRLNELEALDFVWAIKGVTLADTRGLLNESEFIKHSGLTMIARYRNQGLIKPVGKAIAIAGLSYFYHPRQIKELKKKLGVTLDDTRGLLNEKEFRKHSGLTRIAKYRNQGLIKPVGRAITNAGLSFFYHPKQAKELKKKLGITLSSTKGLLNESEFIKHSGLTQITNYRKQGLIKPVGLAMSKVGLSYFYRQKQAKELKKRLGITLSSTKGLLNEAEFRKHSGLTAIAKYSKQGLIKPVGKAMTSGCGVGFYYHPKQAIELKKKIGITLDDTRGLLNESEFIKHSGLTNIFRYRRQGLIKPVGKAMSSGGGGGISFFYHPKQAIELKKKLGITLDDIRGLLNEYEFIKHSGLTPIAKYRKQGLIKPIGRGLSGYKMSFFYHHKQAKELKKKLGITLSSTKGLLNEKQFRKHSGLTQITNYRKQNLIKPIGRAMSKAGLSFFYHPRQIKELKKKLGITLTSTKGLLNEERFKKHSGLTGIARYRKQGLIKPVGKTLTTGGVSFFYHPKQAKELKNRLKANRE